MAELPAHNMPSPTWSTDFHEFRRGVELGVQIVLADHHY
jgi:hypothetical protein